MRCGKVVRSGCNRFLDWQGFLRFSVGTPLPVCVFLSWLRMQARSAVCLVFGHVNAESCLAGCLRQLGFRVFCQGGISCEPGDLQ